MLAPVALLFALPLLWMLLSSLMSNAQINQFPPTIIPDSLHLDGYRSVVENSAFPRWFLNSTIVALVDRRVEPRLLLAGRLRVRAAALPRLDPLLLLILATLIIPFQLTMIPTFIVMDKLGLVDSLGALIVPPLVTPLGVFLMRQFFVTCRARSRRRRGSTAARGSGFLSTSRCRSRSRPWRPWRRSRSCTMWNDLLWPLIAINSDENATLPLGLTTFQGQHTQDFSAVMAGNVITVVPVLIAFLLAQKTFIQSLTSSAVKG